MFKPKVLFYDCEIRNPIRSSSDWSNYEYLGVSVVCAYADWIPFGGHMYTFTEDNLKDFQYLVEEADEIIGFNSKRFDDKLLLAHGITVATTYDLMIEVRRAANEPVDGACTPGYNLRQLAETNLVNTPKLINGTEAPTLFAEDRIDELVEGCSRDVNILRGLYKRRKHLISPVTGEHLNCDKRPTWATNLVDKFRSFMVVVDRIKCVEFCIKYVAIPYTAHQVVCLSISVLGGVFAIKFPVGIRISLWSKSKSAPAKGTSVDEPEEASLPF